MKSFSDRKIRKLNYIIHNPNTVEETAEVLLEVFVQTNAGKVERKIQELSECYDKVSELEGEQIGTVFYIYNPPSYDIVKL